MSRIILEVFTFLFLSSGVESSLLEQDIMVVVDGNSLSYSAVKEGNGQGKAIYLTFDDGPWHGTKDVLSVLASHGVKATFFVNSRKLTDWPDVGPVSLLAAVEAGHLIGDHSFDHMEANTGPQTSAYAYRNVTQDKKYFGAMNYEPVAELLQENQVHPNEVREVINSMSKYVRMPYCNNWRISLEDGRNIGFNCLRCTVPRHVSAIRGAQLAEKLHEERGVQIFGWDVEWQPESWSEDNTGVTESAEDMLALIQNCTPREEGKFVLLAHDRHFQTEQAQAELGRFIELARAEGFTFHTVDTFARTGAGETEGTTSGAGAFMPISLFAVLLSIVLSMKWMQ